MKHIRIRQGRFDRTFDGVVLLMILFILVIVLYPLLFILFASVSEPSIVNTGKILLYPEGFNVRGYTRIFKDARIWTGYMNTFLYTLGGTALGGSLTLLSGYALSRSDLPGRKALTWIVLFPMFFSGGLIPTYLVVKRLGLVDNPLVIIILNCTWTFNIILTKSFFGSTVPLELREAAEIDGCGNGRFFFSIVLPISKAIVAVMTLYHAVYYWNAYFDAMIYLNTPRYYPLQLILREILLSAQAMQQQSIDVEASAGQQDMVEVIKYGVIVVSSLPILCVYPFLQKYFVQGVMIGSVKG